MDFHFFLEKKEEQIGWDFGVGECLCACISLALMGGRNWVGRKKRETVFPQFSSLSCLRGRGGHQESVPETSIGQQSILDRIHNDFQPPFHLSYQKREQEMTRGHGNLHKNHFFLSLFRTFSFVTSWWNEKIHHGRKRLVWGKRMAFACFGCLPLSMDLTQEWRRRGRGKKREGGFLFTSGWEFVADDDKRFAKDSTKNPYAIFCSKLELGELNPSLRRRLSLYLGVVGWRRRWNKMSWIMIPQTLAELPKDKVHVQMESGLLNFGRISIDSP